MQYQSASPTAEIGPSCGFTFDADDVDEILARLRARVEIVDELDAVIKDAPAPYRYAGLHSAIKRDRDWYR